MIDQGELEGGRHYVLLARSVSKTGLPLVAGDFDLLQDEFITRSRRKVILQVFVDKGNLHKAHHAMASLKNPWHGMRVVLTSKVRFRYLHDSCRRLFNMERWKTKA